MVTAKKAGAKKAPAKKAAAKKAPTKKAAAKRSAAKKAARRPASKAKKFPGGMGLIVGTFLTCPVHGIPYPRGASCPAC